MSSARANCSTAPAALGDDARRLLALPRLRTLHGRNRTKADVHLVIDGARRIALKDYSARPWWIRATVGRLLVAREAAAYEIAGDLPGLAPFVGRIGPWALATVWVDGRPLSEIEPGQAAPGLADRLGEIVRDLHGHGVALGDLHHRDVIVAEDGTLHVVDLALAWRGRGGPPRRWVFARLCELDRLAVLRIAARLAGADPESAVATAGGSMARWHARGRRLRRAIRSRRGR